MRHRMGGAGLRARAALLHLPLASSPSYFSACAAPEPGPVSVQITLQPQTALPLPHASRSTACSTPTVETLRARTLTRPSGARCSVCWWTTRANRRSDEPPVVLGRYAVTDSAITFTPQFPFDPGPSVSRGVRSRRISHVRAKTAAGYGRRPTCRPSSASRPGLSRCIRLPTSCLKICCGCTSSSRRRWEPAAASTSSSSSISRDRAARGTGRARGVSAGRSQLLEPGSHPLHAVLRSRPGQGRHPAKPGERAAAARRTNGTRLTSPHVDRCERAAARSRSPPDVSRRPGGGQSRSRSPDGSLNRQLAGTRDPLTVRFPSAARSRHPRSRTRR